MVSKGQTSTSRFDGMSSFFTVAGRHEEKTMLNKFKKAAMFVEFFFLLKYLQEEQLIQDIQVEIADESVLDLAPQMLELDSYDQYSPALNVYLLDKNGAEIAEVKKPSYTKRYPSSPWWSPKSWLVKFHEGETVGESLKRWGEKSNQVFYVLAITTYYGDRGVVVNIHKPPKKFTLLEWFVEKQRRAGLEITQAIGAIDMQGDLQLANP